MMHTDGGGSGRVRSGRPRVGRRGSVLILIVGALALMSVLVVIYVAIGRSDRQVSVSVTQEADVDRTVGTFVDHVLRVLSVDVVSVFPDGRTRAGEPISVLETWDYPSTDYQMRSSVLAVDQDGEYLFDPVGTYPPSDVWTGAGQDPRMPSDPWLSSTLPVWLNFGGDPASYNDADSAQNGRRVWAYATDWAQITDIAPDGRFVNLANLRDNFDARPGFLLRDPDTGRPQISYGLTLYDDQGRPYLAGSAQTTDYGVAADVNRPADWSTRQQQAFRPMGDPDRSPSQLEHRANQWADADGDGMADSRWFELVNASDPDSITSLLPQNGRFRYVFATRIIDLSSLVNVNTAGDFRQRPRRKHPAGLTPAEVDLRRLLTERDESLFPRIDAFDGAIAPNDFTYKLIVQPNPGGGPDDYSGMEWDDAFYTGMNGYGALIWAIAEGLMPAWDEDVSAYVQGFSSDETRAEHYEENAFAGDGLRSSGTGYMGGGFGVSDLEELLTFRAVNNPRASSRLEQTVGGRYEVAPGVFPWSMLRENRGLLVERGGVDADRDGFADTAAMVHFATDVRQLLTTRSGARPLVSLPFIGDFGSAITLDPAVDMPVNGKVVLANAAAEESRRILFDAYARALAPYLEEADAWSGDEEVRTLAYGGYAPHNTSINRGPELAVRVAARMAVNARDAHDTDNEPAVVTVLLDEDARQTLDSGSLDLIFPWWNHQPWSGPDPDIARSHRLDLGANRLAHTSNGDVVRSRALTIYGIEAQPFITEVASFHVYTDAMYKGGTGNGDRDWDDNDPPQDQNITINGNIGVAGTASPDFLMQVLAFQVHNPFDESIALSQLPGATDMTVDSMPLYYIELGGRFYKMVNRTGDASVEPVMLSAGQTRVFYAMSESPETVAERMVAASKLGEDYGAADVMDWLSTQLGVDNPNGTTTSPARMIEFDPTTGVMDSDAPIDLLAPSDSIIGIGPSSVEVRLWRVLDEEVPDPVTGIGLNDPRDDMLVDRIREPGTEDQTRLKHRLVQQEISITGTNGRDENASDPGDNTGYSLTTFAGYRRASNPNGTPPRGAMPAYCVETKHGTSLNVLTETDRFGPPTEAILSLSKMDFDSDDNGYTRLRRLMRDQTTRTLISTLTQPPKSKPTGSRPLPANRDGVAFERLYVELHMDNKAREETELRVADLLSVLAVGPEVDSDPNAVYARQFDRWTTLAEAVALAMNYDTPVDTNHLYYEAADDAYGALDRGCLRLDRFTPFLDVDRNGLYDPTVDAMRHPGIPLALNVLNVFRAVDSAYGSIGQAQPGTVNVGTAPARVLRALPLLNPFEATGADGQPQWWWVGDSHYGNMDIAASVVAYRDKRFEAPHRWRAQAFGASPDFVRGYDQASQLPDDLVNDDGRSYAFGRDASGGDERAVLVRVRERPGVRSVGELMMARSLDSTNDPIADDDLDDIDRLGRNGQGESLDGIATTRYRDDQGGQTLDDGIVDDYDEKLAIINALLNTVSVRSDVFCVWFLVHGYAEGDVNGLSPDEPMTPSVARRYLMVVDRSNVRAKGDRPRVLLMREVPM